MQFARKRRAPVRNDRTVELAHMRIPHGRGDATIGDDSGEIEVLDAGFTQHPFEPRHVEGREGDLLDIEVCGCKLVDELLTPASRREVALLQEWAELFQMWRDDRVGAAAW